MSLAIGAAAGEMPFISSGPGVCLLTADGAAKAIDSMKDATSSRVKTCCVRALMLEMETDMLCRVRLLY